MATYCEAHDAGWLQLQLPLSLWELTCLFQNAGSLKRFAAEELVVPGGATAVAKINHSS
jgi:hypothetical protein